MALPVAEFIIVPGPDGQQWLSEPAGDRPGGSLPAVTNLSATFTTSTMRLTWSYSGSAHTRFEVQYATIDRTNPVWSAIVTVPPGNREYTITNQPAGTQIGARVRAANDD